MDVLNNMGDPELFDGDFGTDIVVVGPGVSGGGDDVLNGGPGSDTFNGGPGNDIMNGGSSRDIFDGGIGNDTIDGGPGDDSLNGNDGDDYVNGGPDNDYLLGGIGNDTLDTGPSSTTSGGEAPGMPGYWEWAYGEDNDDLIYAKQAGGDAWLRGDDGQDRIEGSEFDDDISGGDGADTLLGFGGMDTIHGDSGGDDIFGGAVGDALYGDADNDVIWGDEGGDEFHGGVNDDVLWSSFGPWATPDQPYNGVPAMPGVPDMKNKGDEDCDIEDGHPEAGCTPTSDPRALGDLYSNRINDSIESSSPGILANDTWEGSLTAELVTDVEHGELTLNSNGSFSYQPDENWFGMDFFEYRADNGSAESNVATVTLIVTYEAPVAVNDAYGGPENETLEITTGGSLANDTGDGLSAEVFLEPLYGELTLNSDGTFEYEPAVDFTGTDEFYYVVSDGIGEGTIGRVQITIYDEVPLGGEDSFDTPIEESLEVAAPGVLANDYGEGTLTAALVDDVEEGTLTLNSDGSFEYVPATGYFGTVTFTYEVTNGTETSDPITVTLAVIGDPAVADDDEYHDEAARWLNISDPGVLSNDDGEGITALLIGGPAHGALTLNPDGSFEYTPEADYYGEDSFQYVALSPDGTISNLATVTLTMDDPIVEGDSDYYYTAFEQELNEIEGVLSNDVNANAAEYVANSGPSVGSLTFHADGTFLYEPPASFSGTVYFQYIAVHTASGADDGPVTVTIEVGAEPLMLDQAPGRGAPELDARQLAVAYQAAIERWRAVGVSSSALAEGLADVRLVVSHLPGSVLGAAGASGVIFIDADGAGHGWFVDGTPGDDGEFARQTIGTERVALAGSAAYGRVDLLTALEHEIGHLLGLDHTREAGDIMQDQLSLGTRRWADAVDAALVQLLYEGGQRRRR